jgi:lipoprotein-anchoring transpeptidase ErfK/SrfK
MGDAMKALRTAAITVAAMGMAMQAAAQNTQVEAAKQADGTRLIVVSLEDRKLALVENGEVKKVYSVAVGKASTPSPTGTFTIERRVMNPTYHHGDKTVAPGPGNPVGRSRLARRRAMDAFAWRRRISKSFTGWCRWATRWS